MSYDLYDFNMKDLEQKKIVDNLLNSYVSKKKVKLTNGKYKIYPLLALYMKDYLKNLIM